MITTPPPPTVRENVTFDKTWNGARHKNICVRMVDGSVTVHIPGLTKFIVYGTSEADTLASRDPYNPDALTITSPSNDHFTGRICLGVSTEDAL